MGAAYLIRDGLCSGDGFFYFRLWLIGLGRDAFELAMAHPDNLAGLPEVVTLSGRPVDAWDNDAWPDWQALDAVARVAYEQATGDEDCFHEAIEARSEDGLRAPLPAGEDWDFDDAAETELRLPRLSRMFSLPDPAIRDQHDREVVERAVAELGQTEEEPIQDVPRGASWTEPPKSDPS